MEVSSADKFDSAFKEALKAGSDCHRRDPKPCKSLPTKDRSWTWQQRVECR